jgi:hypothetical protein
LDAAGAGAGAAGAGVAGAAGVAGDDELSVVAAGVLEALSPEDDALLAALETAASAALRESVR